MASRRRVFTMTQILKLSLSAWFAAMLLTIPTMGYGKWKAKVEVDDFTDEQSCWVVFARRSYLAWFSAADPDYYPFIRRSGNELVFGYQSKLNVPVGNVELRIDDNPPLIITVDDIPDDLAGMRFDRQVSSAEAPEISPPADEESESDAHASVDQIVLQNAKLLSPFTAIGGDAAMSITRQLMAGEVLKSRVLVPGRAFTPSTGTFKLDKSLLKAMQACGLDELL